MDLRTLKERYGTRLCFFGGLNCETLIEVRRRWRGRGGLRHSSRGARGGLVIATATCCSRHQAGELPARGRRRATLGLSIAHGLRSLGLTRRAASFACRRNARASVPRRRGVGLAARVSAGGWGGSSEGARLGALFRIPRRSGVCWGARGASGRRAGFGSRSDGRDPRWLVGASAPPPFVERLPPRAGQSPPRWRPGAPLPAPALALRVRFDLRLIGWSPQMHRQVQTSKLQCGHRTGTGVRQSFLRVARDKGPPPDTAGLT